MPNLCFSELTVTGPQAEDFVKACIVERDGKLYFDFEKVTPIPEDVRHRSISRDGREILNDELGDWLREHWGTVKLALWGTVLERRENGFYIFVTTAWSPPLPILTRLLEQFPQVEMEGHSTDEFLNFALRFRNTPGTPVIEKEYVSDDSPEYQALIDRFDETPEGQEMVHLTLVFGEDE